MYFSYFIYSYILYILGDSRLSSMETGTALVRAMSHIMRSEHYKVDVINMSYGEHSHWSSSGRVGELMSEVINKHGVVWVASAGNDGPALSTVWVAFLSFHHSFY